MVVANPQDLVVVRRLGEGSFATVDLCEYSGEDLPLASPRACASSVTSQTDWPTTSSFPLQPPHPSQMKSSSNTSVLVAVKKMKTHLAPETNEHGNHASLRPVPEKWAQNFRTEAALLHSLQHQNVVRCYGTVATAEPELHIVLEYCPGGTLRERIERSDYEALTGLKWLLDIARGMEYLHDNARGARLAHRDLKPENIMLSFEGTAKICDFGLCTGLCMAELQPAKETGPHALPSSPTRHPKNRWSWSRATVTPTAITASPPRKADTARAAAGASGSGSSRAESPISRAGDKARARGTPRGWRTSRPEHSRRPSQSEFSLRLSVSSTGASTGSRAKRPSLPALINSGAWELAFKLNRVGPHYVKAEMTGQTGSSLFMAPENFLRKPYNDKVDIFSFSIIMLEVLARRRAYAGLFLLPDQIAHAVAHKGLRPKMPPKLPVDLQRLLRACWDEDPAARPSSREIVQQLEAFILRTKAEPHLLLPLERRTPGGCLGGLLGAK